MKNSGRFKHSIIVSRLQKRTCAKNLNIFACCRFGNFISVVQVNYYILAYIYMQFVAWI